jgi:hypothetical protein
MRRWIVRGVIAGLAEREVLARGLERTLAADPPGAGP